MLHHRWCCIIMNEIQKVKFNILNKHIYNGSFKAKNIHITELIGGVFYIFRNQLIVVWKVKPSRQEFPKNRSTPAKRLFFLYLLLVWRILWDVILLKSFWVSYMHQRIPGTRFIWYLNFRQPIYNQASHVNHFLTSGGGNPNNDKRQQRG